VFGDDAELCRIERCLEHCNDVICPRVVELSDEIGELSGFSVSLELHRHLDICGVAPNIFTVVVQHLDLVSESIWVATWQVPLDWGTPRKSTPAPALVMKPMPAVTGSPKALKSCVTPMFPTAAPGVPDFALYGVTPTTGSGASWVMR
jgi:hypothetical protein